MEDTRDDACGATGGAECRAARDFGVSCREMPSLTTDTRSQQSLARSSSKNVPPKKVGPPSSGFLRLYGRIALLSRRWLCSLCHPIVLERASQPVEITNTSPARTASISLANTARSAQ